VKDQWRFSIHKIYKPGGATTLNQGATMLSDMGFFLLQWGEALNERNPVKQLLDMMGDEKQLPEDIVQILEAMKGRK